MLQKKTWVKREIKKYLETNENGNCGGCYSCLVAKSCPTLVTPQTVACQAPLSPGGSAVKNPPAMQDVQVWSLGQEDPLEKGMATYSSIFAWEIPWKRKEKMEIQHTKIYGMQQKQF